MSEVEHRLAIEAIRLFLSKTNNIDVDSVGFHPAIRETILTMRAEATDLLKFLQEE